MYFDMGGCRHQGWTVVKGLAHEIIHSLKCICYTGNGESIHDKNLQLMGKTVYSNGDHFVVSSFIIYDLFSLVILLSLSIHPSICLSINPSIF